MIASRRTVLRIGGLALAGSVLPVLAAETAEIRMVGNANGSLVRFAPRGLLVTLGTKVRWRNADAGNVHTSTAFHPQNMGHPLRIPPRAKAWNSDYLLPDETFEVTLMIPGVYDYFCIPHEMAGMVGRILVAADDDRVPVASNGMEELFPSVDAIMKLGKVDP